MSQSNLHALSQPESFTDPLYELIRQVARELITEAVEAELAVMLVQYRDRKEGVQNSVSASQSQTDMILQLIGKVNRQCRLCLYLSSSRSLSAISKFLITQISQHCRPREPQQ